VRDRRGDATAAGAQVEHAWRLETRRVPPQLEHVFDERFGVRARDEHAGRNLKFQVKKVGLAGEVRDGFLFRGALHECAKRAEILVAQHALVIGVKLDPRDVQDVRQQQLGGEARGINVLPREEPARPLQQPPDRPCSAAVTHRGGIVGGGLGVCTRVVPAASYRFPPREERVMSLPHDTMWAGRGEMLLVAWGMPQRRARGSRKHPSSATIYRPSSDDDHLAHDPFLTTAGDATVAQQASTKQTDNEADEADDKLDHPAQCVRSQAVPHHPANEGPRAPTRSSRAEQAKRRDLRADA
jgi:hypothetical protein